VISYHGCMLHILYSCTGTAFILSSSHTKCRQMPRAMYGATSAVSAEDTKLTPWLSSTATPLMCSTLPPDISTTQFRCRSKPASAEGTNETLPVGQPL